MLQRCAPTRVLEYFDRQWHEIKGEWVQGLMNDGEHHNFLNRTNNRLENLNVNVKSVLNSKLMFFDFVQRLLRCLGTLDLEKEHHAILVEQKVKLAPVFEEFDGFQQYLTPYAFKFINAQFKAMRVDDIPAEMDDAVTIGSNRPYIVSARTCTCGFFRAMELPCRHILSFRKSRGLDLFEISLCSRSFVRWTGSEPDFEVQTSAVQTLAVPSAVNKFKDAQQVCSQLLSITAKMPLREYWQ
ncbi:hypothetical protein CAPTEDRAFT_195069 [Capitella teleta]|uniref:SWIM-type domain-containing protein n=1 Tax=Capitella teleta TaxID=283909 RepID=R7UI63_CAPTE|nr:hypothetical protein CAPTEDRAFT_195069 [Capitella teleta]|eukprot:ELU02927.1 hypothetical protein CAPTEDRAFT_195069 [Capitella teleta]